MDGQRYYTTTEIAKEYELQARQLNKLLINEKVVVKDRCGYRLTTHNRERGLERVFVTTFMRSDGTPDESHSLKWTETGKQFIENLLESKGFEKGV
ncbi:phage antirepressor KilAC domain-containing protein [Staphylococcus aureus]|uniref:phage antirepressor KilAC domain-containing protein n=3 Tax=Staphylococcus aureus TaxID=1280 RepID=UPI0020BE1A0D|nr:phage antirepressor KilAC domain-containing protein [Staphylococcus aureus]